MTNQSNNNDSEKFSLEKNKSPSEIKKDWIERFYDEEFRSNCLILFNDKDIKYKSDLKYKENKLVIKFKPDFSKLHESIKDEFTPENNTFLFVGIKNNALKGVEDYYFKTFSDLNKLDILSNQVAYSTLNPNMPKGNFKKKYQKFYVLKIQSVVNNPASKKKEKIHGEKKISNLIDEIKKLIPSQNNVLPKKNEIQKPNYTADPNYTEVKKILTHTIFWENQVLNQSKINRKLANGLQFFSKRSEKKIPEGIRLLKKAKNMREMCEISEDRLYHKPGFCRSEITRDLYKQIIKAYYHSKHYKIYEAEFLKKNTDLSAETRQGLFLQK